MFCPCGYSASSHSQRHAVTGIRLTGDSKLPIGVNGSLSLCVSPPPDWQPIQGVPMIGWMAGVGVMQVTENLRNSEWRKNKNQRL